MEHKCKDCGYFVAITDDRRGWFCLNNKTGPIPMDARGHGLWNKNLCFKKAKFNSKGEKLIEQNKT